MKVRTDALCRCGRPIFQHANIAGKWKRCGGCTRRIATCRCAPTSAYAGEEGRARLERLVARFDAPAPEFDAAAIAAELAAKPIPGVTAWERAK